MLWFFLSFFLMFVSTNFIPPPLGTYIGGGSIFIMIPGLILQDLLLRTYIASHNHLNATVFPRNRKFDFYFETPGPDDSFPIGGGRYVTRLKLSFPIAYFQYKKLPMIFVRHNLPWKARIRLKDGWAYYAGMLLQHANTDNVVLYEYLDDLEIDHAKIYPIFELVHAGGDYPHMSGVVREYLTRSPELTVEAVVQDKSGV